MTMIYTSEKIDIEYDCMIPSEAENYFFYKPNSIKLLCKIPLEVLPKLKTGQYLIHLEKNKRGNFYFDKVGGYVLFRHFKNKVSWACCKTRFLNLFTQEAYSSIPNEHTKYKVKFERLGDCQDEYYNL